MLSDIGSIIGHSIAANYYKNESTSLKTSDERAIIESENLKKKESLQLASVKIKNVGRYFQLLEIAIYVSAIVVAHLITIDRLPTPLQFLKGRFQLASAMMTTGVVLLSLKPLIIPLGFQMFGLFIKMCQKSDAKPETEGEPT